MNDETRRNNQRYENRKKCVIRAACDVCIRNCCECDLLLPDESITVGYDTAIAALGKQIPKKPLKRKQMVFVELDNGRNESGEKDVFYCPIYCEYIGVKYGEHPVVNVQNYCKKCGQ